MIDLLHSYDFLGRYTLVTSLLIVCAILPLLIPAFRMGYAFLGRMPRGAAALLLLILIVALYLRAVMYPHLFLIYLDDYYPLEIANKVLHIDFASLNPVFVANGLVFVPIFAIFGVGFKAAMAFSIALSIGSLLLFFILAYLLTKEYAISLITMALMAVQPSHIQYSFSTYNHTLTFFCLTLALCAFFSYFEIKKRSMIYLCLFSILFLLEMRTEILFIVPILFMYWLYRERSKLREVSIWFPWLFFSAGIVILIPKFLFFNLNLLNYSLMSASNFFANAGKVSGFLGLHPFGFAFIAIGLGVAIYRKKYGLLCISCAAIALLTLVLSMEFSQIQGSRHLHFTIAVLYMLLAFGLWSLVDLIQKKTLKIALLGIIVISIVIQGTIYNNSIVTEERKVPLFNEIYFDTRLAERAAPFIPDGCIVITTHPGKYSATTRMKAVYIEDFMSLPDDLKGTCYVFADDLSCRYPPHEVRDRCNLIREGYSLEYLGMIDETQIPTPNRDVRINATYHYIRSKLNGIG